MYGMEEVGPHFILFFFFLLWYLVGASSIAGSTSQGLLVFILYIMCSVELMGGVGKSTSLSFSWTQNSKFILTCQDTRLF